MDQTTDRRSFLKSGALVAAPLAAAVPVAAFAADDARARLARLEDERAIEALQRQFVRHLNGAGDCGEFIAPGSTVALGDGFRSIAAEPAEAELELAVDGHRATVRCACRVERETAFEGDTTLEQMARFEGHGAHHHAARESLATEFVKAADGWRIAGARLG